MKAHAQRRSGAVRVHALRQQRSYVELLLCQQDAPSCCDRPREKSLKLGLLVSVLAGEEGVVGMPLGSLSALLYVELVRMRERMREVMMLCVQPQVSPSTLI